MGTEERMRRVKIPDRAQKSSMSRVIDSSEAQKVKGLCVEASTGSDNVNC